MPVCTKCNEDKSKDEFYTYKTTGYRYSWCKPCEIERAQKYRRQHRQERADYMSAYRARRRHGGE